jgi:hypothetical protein
MIAESTHDAGGHGNRRPGNAHASVGRLGREDVEYLILDEPEISSPIIMSYRANDRSPLLAHFLKLIDEFDQWTETDISAPRRKGALR